MYLYQITNLINGKLYIGQTNNIEKRWSNHKCCNCPDMAIAKAIKKYGVENFKFEVLFRNVPIEEIDELEIKTIKEKNLKLLVDIIFLMGVRVKKVSQNMALITRTLI